MLVFNVEKLIHDVGGVNVVAKMTDKTRTQPYRWIKTNTISIDVVARILAANPDLNLNEYFEERHDDEMKQWRDALYNASVEAIDRGWCVVPLSIEGKKPLIRWKEFQTNPTTQEQLDDWFDNGVATESGNKVTFLTWHSSQVRCQASLFLIATTKKLCNLH